MVTTGMISASACGAGSTIMCPPELFNQHRFAIIGGTDKQQVGHPLPYGMGEEIFQLG